MYILLVFLPLLGSLIAGFFGRFLGYRGASLISIFCVSSSFFFSLLCFFEVALF